MSAEHDVEHIYLTVERRYPDGSTKSVVTMVDMDEVNSAHGNDQFILTRMIRKARFEIATAEAHKPKPNETPGN